MELKCHVLEYQGVDDRCLNRTFYGIETLATLGGVSRKGVPHSSVIKQT